MTSCLKRRAERALERQLAYQERKAARLKGHEASIMEQMAADSRAVREKLERVQRIPADARVLEVGSGAHGLIFYFEAGEKVGIDPLADHYARLFPKWQGRAQTVAGFGESLPFDDASFDVVLCDNVVDHAENPRRIVEEIARVLKPRGLVYFTVNIHHPAWHWAATLHAAWRAFGIPFEVTPFADHTVHLTRDSALRLFRGLPLGIAEVVDTIAETRRDPPPVRHPADWLKRLFFKNAQIEVIARRC